MRESNSHQIRKMKAEISTLKTSLLVLKNILFDCLHACLIFKKAEMKANFLSIFFVYFLPAYISNCEKSVSNEKPSYGKNHEVFHVLFERMTGAACV